MNTISFLFTVGVIVYSIFEYNVGHHPEWFPYFVGWGLVFLKDIRDLI